MTAFSKEKNYSADPGTQLIRLRVPPECAGLRLDQALARLLPDWSRSRLALWVREEKVLLEGVPALPRTKVWGGESLEVLPEPCQKVLAARPEDIPLSVVHEDESLIVIDKPAGLVVHPGSGNWSGTMMNALLAHAPRLADVPRAGIVHRLDKDTSGLLVVAKTLTAQTSLVRQLQARTVTRIYAAFAHGMVARDGHMDAPIGRHPVHRTRMAVREAGKPAVTYFSVRARYARSTFIECRLETGRTHQIRVHMAELGHPLIGDPVYGTARQRISRVPLARQALHAERLSLVHPASGDTMTWTSPLPADLVELRAALELETA
jgi:23S rRNA pseudouridine1911/1915/1917 synthase